MNTQIPCAKNLYSFKVGCPSYVYPADILPNVHKLASSMDAVEIVLFESSQPENLPPEETVEELAVIGDEQDLSYVIHLPLDCRLGDPDPEERDYAVRTFQTFIQRTALLKPESYIIHFDPAGREQNSEAWEQRLRDGMDSICSNSDVSPRTFAVEMLDYPFEETEEIVEDLNLSVCFEVGHLLLAGRCLEQYYLDFRDRVSVIHLHGINSGKAHVPPDVLGESYQNTVAGILSGFTGIVVLEVFSPEYLKRSIEFIQRIFHD
ncbi:cobamide remodeling phosphodiesterase CbiR [Planctomycetota bacterium]